VCAAFLATTPPPGRADLNLVICEYISDLILRSRALRGVSKDGHENGANRHPSRRAPWARSSSDNGEAVARG
jgi:hypothetical protein